MDTKTKGFLALLGSAMIYGLYPYFVRTFSTMYSPYAQLLVRGGVAMLIVLIIMFFKKEKILVPKNKYLSLGVFIFTIPISSFLIMFSIFMIKASTAIFMLYAGSILVAFIMGTFVFKESVTKSKIFSLSIVILGLIIFAFPFDISSKIGMMLGFLGGGIEGFGNSLRKSLGTIPRNSVLVFQFGFTALFSLIILAISGESFIKEFQWYQFFLTFFYCGSLVGLGYLMLYGFKNFDTNIGTTIVSSEMFFTIIFSLILLGEQPTGQELLAGTLIFLGANIPNLIPIVKTYIMKEK
jgi:drug/metabolite transporter (DMT)-like permease